MATRGQWWFGLVGAGALLFALGMTQFAGALQSSYRYDRIEAEARGRAAAGRSPEPRGLILLLGVLGDLRQDTHALLARGLFGAAGGMTLFALGLRGVWARRRQVSPGHESTVWPEPLVASANDRCATRVAPRSRHRLDDAPRSTDRQVEPIDDDEVALLARFEVLERQVAAGR